jgi:hypothetical protein
MDNHGGMIFTGENSGFVHQISLAIQPVKPCSSKAGGTGEINDNFCLTKYLFHTSKASLTCCKIIQYGTDGFTFSPKEGMLRFLIAINIRRPGPV